MNNVALLTAGSAVYSKKKAKKRATAEELAFNPEERMFVAPIGTQLINRNYLTGFHKRKTERQQKAAEHAKEQARKEKLETRKQVWHIIELG
jgi:ribosomal RNA-processing protein 17